MVHIESRLELRVMYFSNGDRCHNLCPSASRQSRRGPGRDPRIQYSTIESREESQESRVQHFETSGPSTGSTVCTSSSPCVSTVAKDDYCTSILRLALPCLAELRQLLMIAHQPDIEVRTVP